jgi:hypothetical protein
VQTANGDVGEENGLVSQAYPVANGLAAGSCGSHPSRP